MVTRLTRYPQQAVNYISPKLEGRTDSSKQGCGVFARAVIEAGERLVTWSGHLVPGSVFFQMPPEIQHLSLQVEADLYMVALDTRPTDRVNHSCEPNAGMGDAYSLVALRRILPGEEVCYDYAMSDSTAYDEFPCACGSRYCRGKVTAEDWQRTELWERYGSHFSPYLQSRINQRLLRQLDRMLCVSRGARHTQHSI